jgi:O-antigen ligase
LGANKYALRFTLIYFMSHPSIRSLSRLLWALVLVTLPVTSFRFMPFMGAGTSVRPLALYPLVILLPILLMRLKRGEIQRPWPGALTVLLAFVLASLAATAFGATLAPIELRGADFFDRALRAGVTLVIGLAFFVAAVWMNQTEDDLKFSVKWLLVGLVAHLLWGAVQFVGLNTGHRQQLLKIQQLFSVRGLVKNKRISGFAYEPSWLAGQLAALYLPWLVAAVLMRYRVLAGQTQSTVNRLWSFVEPLLLLAALVGVLMTYSRSGLFVVVLAGVATFVLAGGETVSAFRRWFLAGFRVEGVKVRWLEAGQRVVLVLLVVALLAGVGAFLADKGYIATFFKSEKTDLFSYAVDVYLGPRLAYASAALTAFQAHPFTGVGLGASGFWIYQNMPDWVLSGVPEIADQLSPQSNLYPNPKNIYVRLLTETGLPGFVLFLAFYLALLAEAVELLRGPKAARWLAAAGIFALTAVMLQGISQDSFAMPELWLNLGMLAGAAGYFINLDPKGFRNL